MKGFLIVIALFAACTLQAQMVTLVLKGGYKMSGVIIEKTEGSIKIKSKDGNVSGFKSEEVEAIKPYRPLKANNGYYGVLSIGALGGSDLSGNATFVNGFRINKHWGIGLGLGIEKFYNRAYMPAFIEGKFKLFKEGSTPFVTTGFGYDVPFRFTDNSRGGFFGQTFLGFKHEAGNHFGIFTGIGFRYGRLEVENWNWWGGGDGSIKTIYEINRFDLRFGFIFR